MQLRSYIYFTGVLANAHFNILISLPVLRRICVGLNKGSCKGRTSSGRKELNKAPSRQTSEQQVSLNSTENGTLWYLTLFGIPEPFSNLLN